MALFDEHSSQRTATALLTEQFPFPASKGLEPYRSNSFSGSRLSSSRDGRSPTATLPTEGMLT